MIEKRYMGIWYNGIEILSNRNLNGTLCNFFNNTKNRGESAELHREIAQEVSSQLKNVHKHNRIRKNLYPYTFIPLYLFLIVFFSNTSAQSTRGLINDGVELYTKENFADAEVNFKKASELSPESFEAKFNLGNAYYKQQRYDEAVQSFQTSLAAAKTDEEKANVFYNIGNSLLKSNKLDQSIAAYKESLKLNPDDMDAKYNLSYALNQKNNPQQDQQQDKNDDKKNEEENKDQEKQNQDQQNKKDEQKEQQQNQPQQQQQPKISKDEAKRILDALKDNEKELQKELRKIQGQKVTTEKDW